MRAEVPHLAGEGGLITLGERWMSLVRMKGSLVGEGLPSFGGQGQLQY